MTTESGPPPVDIGAAIDALNAWKKAARRIAPRDLEGRRLSWSVNKIKAHRQTRWLPARSDRYYPPDKASDVTEDMSGPLDDHFSELKGWGLEFDK